LWLPLLEAAHRHLLALANRPLHPFQQWRLLLQLRFTLSKLPCMYIDLVYVHRSSVCTSI